MLGISSNKFSQLKSGGAQGRFLSSLDYLKGIAGLDGLSLLEFLNYIEGEDENKAKQLYNWQEKLYKVLSPISLTIRKKFVEALSMAINDGEKVELLCRLVTALSKKDIESLKPLVEAMEKI